MLHLCIVLRRSEDLAGMSKDRKHTRYFQALLVVCSDRPILNGLVQKIKDSIHQPLLFL